MDSELPEVNDQPQTIKNYVTQMSIMSPPEELLRRDENSNLLGSLFLQVKQFNHPLKLAPL
jgi:hypothetical protein